MSSRLKIWWAPAAWAIVILTATTLRLPSPVSGTDELLDKLAHFLMYAGLGFLVYRALRKSGRPRLRSVVVLFIGGLAFAAVDELHQELVPTRVPSLGDWLADATGLAAGLTLGSVALGRRSREPDASMEP